MQYKFYPKLARRTEYLTKKNGKFYVYARYRLEIAEDCLKRCVYCDAHEYEVGGASVMELDHFRPRSLVEFKDLINDPRNLVYSCRNCNGLKHELWPALGTVHTFVGTDGFIDPFEVNRRHYFAVRANGRIEARKSPAGYMISLMGLDRPFMRRLRQSRRLMAKVVALAEEMEDQAKLQSSVKSNSAKAVRLILKLSELERRRRG